MKMPFWSKAGKSLTFICCCCMTLIIHCGLLYSGADAEDKAASRRPKIGVVLGGGGAKGAAHIGVLRVMEELKIPVDFIAGTSMGSIVGGLYASGLNADEVEKLITSIDWKDVFSGDPERKDIDWRRKREDYTILSGIALGVKHGEIRMPKGLVKDQKVNVLFEMLMLHTSEIDDFDKLPIPYRAVAADIETGEMVVLKGGRLADAARASMSVPGAFPPIEINGRVLIDGGIVRNVPVDIVREMGADIIICIDVGKPLTSAKDLGGPLTIMNQMLDIMMNKNVQDQIKTLGPKDVYINPVLGELGSGDFDRAAEIADLGEKAAREKTDALKRYAVSDEEYAAFSARHRYEPVKEVKIASVTVEMDSESNISPEAVSSRMEVRAGDTADIATLQHNAALVYGMGDFQRVDLRMKRRDDGYDLIVKAKERDWGPNYFRFGIALQSDFEAASKYNILLDYTRRWMNRLGAEWKTQVNLGTPSGIYSEFYQPFDSTGLFFISPNVQWKQDLFDVYDGNRREAEYRVTRYEGGIDLGIQHWKYGEARVGYQYARLKASQKTGNVDLPEDKINKSSIVAKVRLDQMDNVNFPNKGYSANFDLLSSMDALGSEDNYNKAQAAVHYAFTFMKQTVLASLKAGTHIGNDLPFYDQVSLGGFLNLSGLHTQQLLGQSMAIGRLISYHRVGESFIGDLYFGGSIESGNVWEKDETQFDLSELRLAGSIFVGYDTIFGPLYIAYGHADGGHDAGYLFLGKTF